MWFVVDFVGGLLRYGFCGLVVFCGFVVIGVGWRELWSVLITCLNLWVSWGLVGFPGLWFSGLVCV